MNTKVIIGILIVIVATFAVVKLADRSDDTIRTDTRTTGADIEDRLEDLGDNIEEAADDAGRKLEDAVD